MYDFQYQKAASAADAVAKVKAGAKLGRCEHLKG